MIFKPNITRINIAKNKFKYVYIKNKNEITNEQILEYVIGLRIPPAWVNINIVDNPNSEIAVTGFDIAGRRQYIYTAQHNEKVRKKKYKNLIDLGKKINIINKDLNKYLSYEKITKYKLVALIVKIIMGCNFRIGTEKGTNQYSSTGITTLKKKHITIQQGHINIKFIGKKGVLNVCNIPRRSETMGITNFIIDVHKNTKKKDDFVFLYQNERINFLDINNFLKKYGNITSKSFRTWNANVLLLQYLPYYFDEKSLNKRKKYLNMIVTTIVAPALHHTVSICKKSYLLKELQQMYLNDPLKLKSIINPNKDYLYKTKLREEINKMHKAGHGKIIPRKDAIFYFMKILGWFVQHNISKSR